MDNFQKIIETILQKNDVVDYDKKTFDLYLKEEKKNSVVSIVTKKSGEKLFFKAIKPHANPRNVLDYKKGLVLNQVLLQAGVTSYPEIVFFSKEENIHYLFARVVPIEGTLSDQKLTEYKKVDIERIIKLYEENKRKIQDFLTDNITDAALLYPHSNISQNYSFLGLVGLFEHRLNELGIITGDKGYEFSKRFLTDLRNDFFASNKPYLIHGDFAPHNIVYGDKTYFVDWDRAFITFNSSIGENFDRADLYTASHLNKEWLDALYVDDDSFKLCLYFHLLSKLNNIKTSGEQEKRHVFFAWAIEQYKKL